MSTFALTKASTAALAMLCRTAGTDQLLLTQPARELRAEITVEPIGTADQRGQIEAVLHLREQRHSITLQRDDGANAQHLAEWVEAAANGTADTALAIPQRAAPAPLLPCRDCGSEAIGYDYASQGSTFRHGVKCRHRDCQSVEGAETETEAHAAWNEMQAEPAPAQDEREVRHNQVMAVHRVLESVSCASLYSLAEAVVDAGYTRPAQTEQQPVEVMLFQLKHPDTGDAHTVALTRADIADGMDDTLFEKLGDLICDCQPVGETNVVDCNCDDYIYEFELVNAAPIAQTVPQPEQSGLVEALEAIVRQYPNPDISHVDYRVHVCKQAEMALANYRAAQAASTAA